MSWNYRILRSTQSGGDPWYAVHEVYYAADGSVNAATERPMALEAENTVGLLWHFAVMVEALEKPVLDATSLEEIEPAQELSDAIKRVLADTKAYASGME